MLASGTVFRHKLTSMTKPMTSDDRFKELENKARNESQKSLLLCFVLDKTMHACTDTVQHARELRNPKSKDHADAQSVAGEASDDIRSRA